MSKVVAEAVTLGKRNGGGAKIWRLQHGAWPLGADGSGSVGRNCPS